MTAKKNDRRQDPAKELNGLLDEVRGLNKELDAESKKLRGDRKTYHKKAAKNDQALKKMSATLDKTEKRAGDEFDRLMLEQAEVLVEE